MARYSRWKIFICISSKEDPLLTVGYNCIQNTFLNTCHDMCSVCSKRSPHTSPFLVKLIRLNSLGFAVQHHICYCCSLHKGLCRLDASVVTISKECTELPAYQCYPDLVSWGYCHRSRQSLPREFISGAFSIWLSIKAEFFVLCLTA